MQLVKSVSRLIH